MKRIFKKAIDVTLFAIQLLFLFFSAKHYASGEAAEAIYLILVYVLAMSVRASL